MENQHAHLLTPRDAQAFRELFQDSLREMYWSGKTLVRALPDLIKKTESDSLSHTLSDYLGATRDHVECLEECFFITGGRIKEKKCEAMESLIREAERILLETEAGLVREAAIISAVQKIVHYEIACYGTLCAYARALEEKEAASLLHETLEEEKEADELLSEIAESMQMELIDRFDDFIDLSDTVYKRGASPADFR